MKRFLKVTVTSRSYGTSGLVQNYLVNIDQIKVVAEIDKCCIITLDGIQLPVDQPFVEIKRQLQDGVL